MAKKKFTTPKLLDISGQPFEIKGTILGEKTHGYNLASGSWALYPNYDGSSTPAEFVIFREYRKRRPVVINKNNIVGSRDEV